MTKNDDIRRSTLRHFLPGLALFWAGASLLAWGGVGAWGIALAAAETGAMALGYHLTLKAGRKSLRKLSGIRGLIAGLATPAATALAFIPAGPLARSGGITTVFLVAGGVSFVGGACMAATMFIQRRTRRLREPLRELPGESLEDWFARVERRADELVQRLKARAVDTPMTPAT